MSVTPVSVIIPCYCCSQSLSRAVDSVLSQSRLPAEIVLVDDASPDQGQTMRRIEQIVRSCPADSVVRIRSLFLERNRGPGGARNAGWDIATQPYVAFLDADDAWASKKLEIQYEWMLAHAEFTLTCHKSVLIDEVGPAELSDEIVRHCEIGGLQLIVKNYIPTRSVMLVNQNEFRFPSDMRYAEDYWLWLVMNMSGERMAILDLPLAFSYKREYGEGGLSANLKLMHRGVLECYKELYRQKFIGAATLFLAQLWEKVRYFRRLIVSRVVYSKLN